MILNCPDCSASYIVPASTFAVGARNVRCAKCGHVWLADLPSSTTAFAWPEAPTFPAFSSTTAAMPSVTPQFAPPPPPCEAAAKIIANDTDLATFASAEKASPSLVKDPLENESSSAEKRLSSPIASNLDYTAFESALETLSASLRATDLFDIPPSAPATAKDSPRTHAGTAPKTTAESLLENLRDTNPSLDAFFREPPPTPQAQPFTSPFASPAAATFFKPPAHAASSALPSCAPELQKLPESQTLRESPTLDVRKKNPPPRLRLPVVWADPRVTRLRRALAILGLTALFASGIVWSFIGGPLEDFEMPSLSLPTWELPSLELPHIKTPPLDFPKTPIKKKTTPQPPKEILGKDLKFENVRSERRFEDGTMQLVVDGEIRNPTSVATQVPAIKITALNTDGEILETWRIDAPQPQIESNGTAPFHTAIAAPQGAVVQVNLRFVPPLSPPALSPPAQRQDAAQDQSSTDIP